MIRFLARNSRWILLFSVLAGLAAGLGGAGLIAVINRALDRDAPAAETGALFAGLCALLLLARGISALLLMRLGQNVILDLRLTLSRRILAAPFPRLQALGPARILACLTQDVATLAEAFQRLPLICVNAAMVAGCLAYLGWLSGLLAALVGAALLLGIGSFLLADAWAVRGLRMARECDDALHGHFRGLTHGIKELKLHRPRREAFLDDCLESAALHYRRHYLRGMGFSILAGNWGNGLFYIVIGLVLFVLPAYREVAPEVLRGYCLAILYLMAPMGLLMDGLPALGRAGIALKKIEALGKEPDESQPPEPRAAILPRLFPKPAALEMIGVTHRYRGERDERCFTLGPLDLTLRPGELVFLIGGNGSGKTTLSLLLVGLYAPEQGEIRLGGRRITEANRESYRQRFSAVFSDFYLFDSLLGFRSRELDAEARAYLAGLQLDHKVRIENGEFSTVNLSQGQRKRLALLVAYLEDRPFYVFDEWAADQDPVFKKIFYTEILPALKARGKTVVVITHDDSYFHVADRCLRLAEGQISGMPAAGRPRETTPGTDTGNDWGKTYAETSP
jgi:putative ATP-binding cassette transporter